MFPDSAVGKVLFHIAKNHKLVLCKHILDELSNVFKKKFLNREISLNDFIKNLKYELVGISIKDLKKYPKIRDKHDIPVLANAIEAKSDIGLFDQRLPLLLNMPLLPCGKIGISLFQQGFFYGVYAGGTEYVFQSCSVGITCFPLMAKPFLPKSMAAAALYMLFTKPGGTKFSLRF